MAESEYMYIQVCWCSDAKLLMSSPWQGSHSPVLPLEGQVPKRISQESLWPSFIKSLYYPHPDLWKTHLVSLHMCWHCEMTSGAPLEIHWENAMVSVHPAKNAHLNPSMRTDQTNPDWRTVYEVSSLSSSRSVRKDKQRLKPSSEIRRRVQYEVLY